MRHRGAEIAQIVRGEQLELAPGEIEDVLRSGDSYYPDDLLVVGWTAAFLYDSVEGVEPVMQLLQYANTQLLEYRYYDTMLTAVLAEVYRKLDSQAGVLARWRMAKEARRLNRLRLEVRELRRYRTVQTCRRRRPTPSQHGFIERKNAARLNVSQAAAFPAPGWVMQNPGIFLVATTRAKVQASLAGPQARFRACHCAPGKQGVFGPTRREPAAGAHCPSLI